MNTSEKYSSGNGLLNHRRTWTHVSRATGSEFTRVGRSLAPARDWTLWTAVSPGFPKIFWPLSKLRVRRESGGGGRGEGGVGRVGGWGGGRVGEGGGGSGVGCGVLGWVGGTLYCRIPISLSLSCLLCLLLSSCSPAVAAIPRYYTK